VKTFWGLYNHLNLDKMPVGSNLRVFKSHIQPVWEVRSALATVFAHCVVLPAALKSHIGWIYISRQDHLNKEGGNWIVVPRPRDVTGVLVFKELLLSIIGGDLDKSVNGTPHFD